MSRFETLTEEAKIECCLLRALQKCQETLADVSVINSLTLDEYKEYNKNMIDWIVDKLKMPKARYYD